MRDLINLTRDISLYLHSIYTWSMTSNSSLIHKIEQNEKKALMGEQQINQTLNND